MNTPSLSIDEANRRISQLSGIYDPDSNLEVMDQLLICESFVKSTPVNPDDWDGRTILRLRKENAEGENGSDNGSVNGGCKRRVNFDLTENKHRAIARLNDFSIPITPLEIEHCLQEIFSEYPCKDRWWLYVGQHWTQRQINWRLKEVLKRHAEGRITKSSAACFTFLIMKKKKRKIDIAL